VNTIPVALQAVRDSIAAACRRSGRSPDEVRLVGVTKGVDEGRILEAHAAGLNDFGENYLQEAKRKIETLQHGICWHMIGYIQTNKVKYMSRLFKYVHSVDRIEVLEALERCGKETKVLFELNLSGEETKHGATEEGLGQMLEKVPSLRHIVPVGLMTMAPFFDHPEKARPLFRRLKETLLQVNEEFSLTMKELSMGMSSDFEVAVEEGATMVRVGTAIFGERP
jgi:PLP dependent protein